LGWPHCGHDSASVEICRPHAEQLIRGMKYSTTRWPEEQEVDDSKPPPFSPPNEERSIRRTWRSGTVQRGDTTESTLFHSNACVDPVFLPTRSGRRYPSISEQLHRRPRVAPERSSSLAAGHQSPTVKQMTRKSTDARAVRCSAGFGQSHYFFSGGASLA
jgi:hypothetical protein